MKNYGFYTENNYIWHNDSNILLLYQQFFGFCPQYVKDRHFNLYHLAKLAKAIDGDTAECGVRHGFGSYLIINSLNQPTKIHHLFDSFEGLSEPTSMDINPSAPIQWSKGDLSVPLDEVKNHFVNFKNIKFYKGWIPERFSNVASKNFSLVHIDVDLYEPTKSSLEYFYPKMQKGGIIICDDYGSTSCPGAKLACDEFIADKEEDLIFITTSQCFIIKN